MPLRGGRQLKKSQYITIAGRVLPKVGTWGRNGVPARGGKRAEWKNKVLVALVKERNS